MTHYTSSKGQQLAIDAMPFPYLKSALAKLEREQPEREAEIEAMRREVAVRDAAFQSEQTAQTQEGARRDEAR